MDNHDSNEVVSEQNASADVKSEKKLVKESKNKVNRLKKNKPKKTKSSNHTGGVMGIWDDDHKILIAAKKAKTFGFKKLDAITPFPVHGMEEALEIKRSWIPYVTFIMGVVGCAAGVWLTWWTSAVDWPINVGGKPMWSLPAFMPIIFEVTILFAAHSSVLALIVACGLPKINPPVVDPDLTSHKFGLFVPENDEGFSFERVEKIFKDLGAEKIHRVERY